jgi:hypothetical protein
VAPLDGFVPVPNVSFEAVNEHEFTLKRQALVTTVSPLMSSAQFGG